MSIVGRGARSRPPNRFASLELEEDLEYLEHDEQAVESRRKLRTRYYPDESQGIVSENQSPDIFFRYSLNPYRGCAHGCAYCYARPTHEFLGWDAGLDFESKILVKRRAPQLFREHLRQSSWEPETIMFSGVTDCFQPAERHFQLTRQCIEVAWKARQPISIVTKNALLLRDLDLLVPLAAENLVHVAISITSLDAQLARVMEPRTSTPAARLAAVQKLSDNGVTTQVMVAPIIPGLNDHEVAPILKAASEAGAQSASYVMLRLPSTVEPVFNDWLKGAYPERHARVMARIRSVRNGQMNDSAFGTRMMGQGEVAQQIQAAFKLFRRRFGLDRPLPTLVVDRFQRPSSSAGQQFLF